MKEEANASKAVIKMANFRPSDLGMPPGTPNSGGGYWSLARFLSGP